MFNDIEKSKLFINPKRYFNKEKEKLEVAGIDFYSLLKKKSCEEVLKLVESDKFVKDSLLLLKHHDEKSFVHSIEVANIMNYVTTELGVKINEKDKEDLVLASLLHDYGKIFIDSKILNKSERLTDEDYAKIKEHPEHSFDSVNYLSDDVAKVVVAHHKHQLNSYPDKKEETSDSKINRLSRILAMVDSFEAMVAERPGNPPKSINYINKELNSYFNTPEDEEIKFLLNEYYYKHYFNNDSAVSTDEGVTN